MLIQLGAKTNVIGSDKMTPVHYASRYGKNVTENCDDYDSDSDTGLSVLKMLIKYGGDSMAKDIYNLTPLHHAAMRGNNKIVEHLVKGWEQLLEDDGAGSDESEPDSSTGDGEE